MGAAAGDLVSSQASAGPFVLNLCSSTTPMALAQTDLPELKRFTFFVSRRFEEGRERFRLHMGYFATLAEAEEWLSVVREIYPGSWAGEAPGRKIRERAAAAAAAAQHAAGPQAHAAVPHTAIPHPVASPPHAVVPRPAAGQAAPAATVRALSVSVVAAPDPAPQPQHVPVVHAAPPIARVAPQASPPPARQAAAPPRAQPAPAPVSTKPAPAVPDTAARALRPGKPPVKPVFEDSNVREVLKALGDSSATGETRLMHAPPQSRETSAPESDPLSDSQVLRLLESRRPEANEAPAAELVGGSIPLLRPDDTGTRRALREAVAGNVPVAFAVQLQWSVQPVELDKVPLLAIFSAYTLYTVEGSRDGRKWFGLRLGFFRDAIAAKQVAHYVRSEFTSVAVVPVSPQEKSRATSTEQAATLPAPVAPRVHTEEKFPLIEDNKAAVPQPQPAAPSASPRSARPKARLAIGRALRQADTTPPARALLGARVGARERRGPHTLEETLEILGASELSIDDGNGESINDSGVRHLRVQVQKNSPFTRLIERLSERMKKP